MGGLPALTPKKILRILNKKGFYIHHQVGSHIVLKHPADVIKRITVPMHNKDLKIKTLRSIMKQAGLSMDDIKKPH